MKNGACRRAVHFAKKERRDLDEVRLDTGDGDGPIRKRFDFDARVFASTGAAGVAELVHLVGTREARRALAIPGERRGSYLRALIGEVVVEQRLLHHVFQLRRLLLTGDEPADPSIWK